MEYDKYQIDRMVRAKNEFRSLLKETKLITYKSFDLVRESERHYKDILDLLKVQCFPVSASKLLGHFTVPLRMTNGFWCWIVFLKSVRISFMGT